MKQFELKDKQLALEVYRNDFGKFIERVFSIISPHSQYKHNWHIDLIAEYLTACQNGQIKRFNFFRFVSSAGQITQGKHSLERGTGFFIFQR